MAFQEAQLCLWREETVEVSFYLARKHQTQIQVVHVVYIKRATRVYVAGYI